MRTGGEKNQRKTFVGIVTSNKMDRTITVAVERKVPHPVYKRIIRKTSKLHAHDPENSCSIGDRVRVMATRPMSKLKRWRLVEIVEKVK